VVKRWEVGGGGGRRMGMVPVTLVVSHGICVSTPIINDIAINFIEVP